MQSWAQPSEVQPWQLPWLSQLLPLFLEELFLAVLAVLAPLAVLAALAAKTRLINATTATNFVKRAMIVRVLSDK
jgi:hypothetical protein